MRNSLAAVLTLIPVVALQALPSAACRPRTYRATTPAAVVATSLPEVGVVVLGVVQDGGLPQIGDHCPNCRAARADPGKRGRVACLGIFDRKTDKAWLIDATPDLPAQWDDLIRISKKTRRPGRTPPDGIFLTHAHMGHYTGLLHLGKEAFGATEVPVWGTPRMLAHLRGNAPWATLIEGGHVDPRRIVPGTAVVLREGLTVTPIVSPHRQEWSDTVAYIIEAEKKMLYVPDTDGWEGWSPSIEELVGSVDYALLDATFYSGEELPGRDLDEIPHPLVTESMDRLDELAAKRPWSIGFIHMNHTNPLLSPESDAREAVRVRNFSVAARGRIASLSDARRHP